MTKKPTQAPQKGSDGLTLADINRMLEKASPEERAQFARLAGGLKDSSQKRERKTYHLHTLIKESTGNRLDDYSQRSEIPKSQIVERAILDYLEKYEGR